MYLCVDIGGTKTLLAVFDAKGKIIEEHKFPTNHSYDDFSVELAEAVDKLTTNDFRAAAVAIPGKVDRKNGIGVAFGNLPWENVPIEIDVEKVAHCPCIIENDANLAGLSEAHEIIDKYKKVLYVTISTGIGGIFVVNGVMDPDTIDAEIGHMSLEHIGKFEEWEDFASGRAIVEKYGKKASEINNPSIWHTISRNIAAGLIVAIATLTPDAIVLGGGVGTHLPKFKKFLEKELLKFENPLVQIPPVLKAKHPQEAVIYGCYQLARSRYGK